MLQEGLRQWPNKYLSEASLYASDIAYAFNLTCAFIDNAYDTLHTLQCGPKLRMIRVLLIRVFLDFLCRIISDLVRSTNTYCDVIP